MKSVGTLYLVATPIGNLEDISARAIRILNEVALIAAEDTRVTLPMLRRFEIKTRVVSYHDNSSSDRVNDIMDALSTGDVAVVSDAGMPGISDPGSMLVKEAVQRGFPIVPIPGASAVIAAAAMSAAADQGFVFGGFLPRRAGERTARLHELTGPGLPVILFEAPGRMLQLLEEIADLFLDSHVTIGREVTKLHEEWLRGRPADLVADLNPRGEFVLALEARATETSQVEKLDATLKDAIKSGASVREAVDNAIAATGLGRKQVYARALEIRDELSAS
jgi:16S rRNA (cytidine1402-2'-O)-methyltransferase